MVVLLSGSVFALTQLEVNELDVDNFDANAHWKLTAKGEMVYTEYKNRCVYFIDYLTIEPETEMINLTQYNMGIVFVPTGDFIYVNKTMEIWQSCDNKNHPEYDTYLERKLEYNELVIKEQIRSKQEPSLVGGLE